MKKDIHRRLWPLSLALVVLCGACSKDDDPWIPPTPTPQPNEGSVGELTYTAPVIGGGNGTGTASDPAVVHYGETLSVEVSQKTSYTDPNGEVFVCEPKAVIKLSVAKDTLYAKDLQALLEHNESKSDLTTSTANEKKTVQQLQTFNVGGNEITFDHAYEIYTHVNSLGKSVELPYLKDGLAKIGKPEADESKPAASPARVVGIRVSPLAPSTRAGSITDTTAYEVSVSFTVDLTSVNAKATKAQSLYFKVDYIGVVESTTVIPDPKTEFSYKLGSKSGTSSAASPFEFVPGKTLSLEWQEEATYSYFSIPERSMIELRYEPKAHVEVNAESVDTIWVSDISELSQLTALDPVAETTGTNPVDHTGSYAFEVAGQKISLDFGYQSYPPFTVEGEEVNLPYLMLKAPEIGNVDVAEVPNGVLIGKKGKLYTVNVTINQELSVVNSKEPKSEHLQYVIRYIGAIAEDEPQPVTLVDIKYREGYEWYEPRNNLPLRYCRFAYRDSIFSDGSVRTAKSWNIAHAVDRRISSQSGHGETLQVVEYDHDTPFYYFAVDWTSTDTSYVWTRTIAVPDISLVDAYVPDRTLTEHDWAEYPGYNPADPQPGWYRGEFFYTYNAYLTYNYEEWGGFFAYLYIEAVWINDICYVYDDINGGQLLDFLQFKPEFKWSFDKEETTMPTGEPAIVFTMRCIETIMGRTFLFENHCTVYQYDPAKPPF